MGGESSGPHDTVRLVECDVSLRPDYVALSHAWGLGEHRPLVTVGDNVEAHKTGIQTPALSGRKISLDRFSLHHSR